MAKALTVQFRAKPVTFAGKRYVKVPALRRSHADIAAFRQSRAFGGFANSELFEDMLRGAVGRVVGERIWLDEVPAGVKVDCGGLLATVTVEVPDAR